MIKCFNFYFLPQFQIGKHLFPDYLLEASLIALISKLINFPPKFSPLTID